jgi:hypothetical protein
MHEYSLYAEVPPEQRYQFLQQLTGVTCMRPVYAQEVHLVFKAQTPLALRADFPGGNASNDKQQETQRLMRVLNSGIYYMQVVGKSQPRKNLHSNGETNGDVHMTNGNHSSTSKASRIEWFVEFKDTPEAGKQALSSRYIARTKIEEGDVMNFMAQFGYDFVARYAVDGHKFYDQETTLFVHRALKVPEPQTYEETLNCSFLDTPDLMEPLDGHGGYILQASIDASDANNQEMKDLATKELLAMKETLKTAVDLTPGDRLALDVKIPISAGRLA